MVTKKLSQPSGMVQFGPALSAVGASWEAGEGRDSQITVSYWLFQVKCPRVPRKVSFFADCVCLPTLRCSSWSNVLSFSAVTRGSLQGGLAWLELCVCVFSFLPNSLRAWQGQERGSWLFLAPCSSEWIVHNKRMLMLSVFMKALEFISFAKKWN